VIKEMLNHNDTYTFLAKDEKLFYAAMADDDIQRLEASRWWPDTRSTYIGYYDGQELKAICQLEPFTNITAIMHCYTASKYWGEQDDKDIGLKFLQWIKDNTSLIKISSYVPDSCKQVHNSIVKLGMRKEATLIAPILWRNKLENLTVYSIFFDRRNTNG